MIRPGADPPSPHPRPAREEDRERKKTPPAPGRASPAPTRRDGARAADAPESAPQFYRSVVDDADELIEADEIQGVDRELSLLRVKFRQEMDANRTEMLGNPEQYALMLKSIEMIVRTVSARYRMSARKSEDLAGSLAEVLERMGMAFWGDGGAPL